MTGHRPWKELYERTFTPEQRARIEAESERMFEEDTRRRRGEAPAAEGNEGSRGAEVDSTPGALRANRKAAMRQPAKAGR